MVVMPGSSGEKMPFNLKLYGRVPSGILRDIFVAQIRFFPFPPIQGFTLRLLVNSSSASSSSSTSGFSGLSHELVLLYLAGGGVGGGGVGGGGSGDDSLARAVLATEVLVARDPITWNWPLIVSLLKWSVALANGDEPGTAGGEKDGEGRGMDVGTNAPRTLPTRARTPTHGCTAVGDGNTSPTTKLYEFYHLLPTVRIFSPC